jgi:threonine dehydrogenase-like Zn-dependent dehydrogenase
MATLQAQAFWITAPGRGELRLETLALPGPDEVLVKTLYTGISRGTESLVFRGEVPQSQYRSLRAPFQQGDFPAPVKYGYCNVGVVEAGPESLLGKIVFCLYPHQDRYVVPATAVTPVPPAIPPERAVLAANMETALNGLWDAAPRLGDRIAVIGAGTVGCLVAWLAGQLPGCEVQLVDVDQSKETVASRLGVKFTTPQLAQGDQDRVIHASGTSDGLITALGLAGFETTVLEMSWFGTQQVNLPLGEAFHSRRLSIRSSQVSAVATAQRSRWDPKRRLQTALKLLDDQVLDHLISGASPFTELPRRMAELSRGSQGVLCHRIVYSKAG